MTVYHPGTQTRSFCYVADLVEGLMRLMESEHTGPINLGNPGEFTIKELAEVVQVMYRFKITGVCGTTCSNVECLTCESLGLFQEVIDPEAIIEYRNNTPDDPQQRKPDITLARTLLGWEPKVFASI